MLCLHEVYNENGSFGAIYLQYRMHVLLSQSKQVFKQQYSFKYDGESGKTNKNGRKYGRLHMIEFHFFGMPINNLGSLGKMRVGRVTGNTHIYFWPKRLGFPHFGLILTNTEKIQTTGRSK